MTNPVDLENLRDMTGGDLALERELFDVYLTSSEACLALLHASKAAGGEEAWRAQAHAWKGMSLNLGADALGKLCAEAQTSHLAPPEKKDELLKALEEEFARVKAFLGAC